VSKLPISRLKIFSASPPLTLGYQLRGFGLTGGQNRSMRKAFAWVPLATALGVIAGCSGTISPGGATTLTKPPAASSTGTASPSSSAGTPSGKSLSLKQICQGSYSSAVLLDWAPGTVSEFRSYQYGGPTATVPLAHAFPGIPVNTRGAWCGTKAGPHATHWWAVVMGQKPASLLVMTGGDEGVRHGLLPVPPRIP
jgi:hypothetical protein